MSNPFLIFAVVTCALELACLWRFNRTDRGRWLAGVYFFWVLNLWNAVGYFATVAGA